MTNLILESLLNKFKGQILSFSVCLLLSLNTFSQNNNWRKLPFKLDDTPRFFYTDTFSHKLIIGGNFNKVDSVKSNLFMWDDTNVTFLKLNQLKTWPPVCANRFNNNLYVGGFPSNCGIFLWNDTNWIPLSSTRELISAFYNYHDTLLVGGFFDSISGLRAGPVVYYSNNKWTSLYGIDSVIGLDINHNYSSVNSIVEYDGDLFAAGNIDNFGALKEILRWHNGKWTDVGGGIGNTSDDWVNDMIVYKGELYVAGRFFRKGGAADNCIIRWDGTKWKTVGGGVEGTEITDLQVFNNELWAVGKFWAAGGVPAHWIAKWDGNKWCSFGNQFDNAVLHMGVYNNELYIGGGFRSIDGDTSIAYIAKWVGGSYTDTCGFMDYSGVSLIEKGKNNIYIYPNPNNGTFTLNFNNTQGEKQIAIYNLQGKLVANYTTSEGVYEVQEQLIHGMYFIKAETSQGTFNTKFVVE